MSMSTLYYAQIVKLDKKSIEKTKKLPKVTYNLED